MRVLRGLLRVCGGLLLEWIGNWKGTVAQNEKGDGVDEGKMCNLRVGMRKRWMNLRHFIQVLSQILVFHG